MPKLYFRYGTVNCGKSMEVLKIAHDYKSKNKKVVIIKPAIDIRFGIKDVKSRVGISQDADILVTEAKQISEYDFKSVDCVLVDEVQFLSTESIDELRKITLNAPVICYGLRTDFKSNLFLGSARLFALADNIEEIKTTCAKCNSKAIFNIRIIDGKKQDDGPQIKLGAEEMYIKVCNTHFL